VLCGGLVIGMNLCSRESSTFPISTHAHHPPCVRGILHGPVPSLAGRDRRARRSRYRLHDHARPAVAAYLARRARSPTRAPCMGRAPSNMLSVAPAVQPRGRGRLELGNILGLADDGEPVARSQAVAGPGSSCWDGRSRDRSGRSGGRERRGGPRGEVGEGPLPPAVGQGDGLDQESFG